MKVFTVIFCIALAHGAFGQLGFWGSLTNAVTANAQLGSAAVDVANSVAKTGISATQGGANLALSAGRKTVDVGTSVASGAVGGAERVATTMSNAILPSVVSRPVNGVVGTAASIEQAKLSAMNGIAGMGFGAASTGVNILASLGNAGTDIATGAIQLKINTFISAVKALANTISAMSRISQAMANDSRALVSQLMANMPRATTTLVTRLNREGMLDSLKGKIQEGVEKIKDIVTYYEEFVKGVNVKGADLRDFLASLSGNVSALIRGDEKAVDKLLTALKDKVPSIEAHKETAKAILEKLRQNFIHLGEFREELASGIDKAKETYGKLKAKLSKENLDKLSSEIRSDLRSLLTGDKNAVQNILKKIKANHPELAAYEASIKTSLEAVQQVGKDLTGIIPIVQSISNEVKQILGWEESKQLVSVASSNLKNVVNSPTVANIMSSARVSIALKPSV